MCEHRSDVIPHVSLRRLFDRGVIHLVRLRTACGRRNTGQVRIGGGQGPQGVPGVLQAAFGDVADRVDGLCDLWIHILSFHLFGQSLGQCDDAGQIVADAVVHLADDAAAPNGRIPLLGEQVRAQTLVAFALERQGG